MQTPWEHRFAQRTQRMRSSAIRELLKLTEQPDVISFAGGLPERTSFQSTKSWPLAVEFCRIGEPIRSNMALRKATNLYAK